MQSDPRSGQEPRAAVDRERLDETVASLYEALRRVAHRAVTARRGQRILDPTDLVHECYIKLARNRRAGQISRPEFLALAAKAIRTVLVDRARELGSLKRGGAMRRVTLDGSTLMESEPVDLIGLEAALAKLAALDARMAQVVELRFFGGLEVREVAEALGVSSRTVDSDWSLARAWLHRELKRQGS